MEEYFSIKENDIYSFYKVSISKDKIWNYTNLKKTILRIIYFIICSLILIIPFYVFLDTENFDNFFYNYLLFGFACAFLMYGIFFFFKAIILKMDCLVNNLFFEGFEETPLI